MSIPDVPAERQALYKICRPSPNENVGTLLKSYYDGHSRAFYQAQDPSVQPMQLALPIGKGKKSRMSFENSNGFLQDGGSGCILRQNQAKVKGSPLHVTTGYFHLAVISDSEMDLLTLHQAIFLLSIIHYIISNILIINYFHTLDPKPG